MSENVEMSTLDLRYEGHRLRDNAREARLLASIAQRGIEEPLEGVDTPDARLLLDGFKRYRSARKLGIDCVPYVSLGEEEATGILNLMRASTDKALGILEQARFIVDLLTIHGMSLAEVSETLSRSKGWVSMRRRLLDEMSPAIEEILFRGAFPVYSYMYTLRPFMRMNANRRDEIERFVGAVAGQRLLEAAVLEVLPGVQPLRHEVFPARGVDVLGLRGQAVRDRQHRPGASARQRQTGGDRAGNGLLRPALRLWVPLPRDSPPEPQGRRGAKFLDRRDQLPAGPQLREPGGSEPASVPMGHGAHGPTPGIQRHRFLRELFALSRHVTATVFVEALARALRYRVVQMETLQRIAWLCMSQGQHPLPDAEIDEDFRQRPAYEEGFLTDEPDLSVYDEMPREDPPADEPESEDQDG